MTADGAAGLLNLVASHAVEGFSGVIELAPIQSLQMGAKIVLGCPVVVSLAMRTHAKVSKQDYLNYPQK